MPLNREIIVAKLKDIKPLLQKQFNLNELALFGSYARNEQNEKSDIDIMVGFEYSDYRNLCNTAYQLYQLFPDKKCR